MALTYDALGRWAEKFSGGDYIQAVYDPAGRRLALMVNGSTLGLARVSLAGDAVADYSSTGLNSYVHPDWLGSTRIKSTPGRTFLNGNDLAFAPFGEQYVTIGSVDAFFTVATHDLEVDLTDFPAREYHATQGRWLTPDPAGLEAVDLTNPQSWNRYAYVMGNPLGYVDPSGTSIVPCESPDSIACVGNDPSGGDGGVGGGSSGGSGGAPCALLASGSGFSTEARPCGGSVSGGGGGAQNSSAQPPKTGNLPPCNDAKNNRSRFFQQLPGMLNVAKQLNVPAPYVVGLASYESGWLDNHNYALRNLWGLTNAGVNNLGFKSFEIGNTAFVNQVRPFIQGAQTIPNFFSGLQKEGYNSANPNYFSMDPTQGMLFNRISNIGRWGQACGASF